MPERVPVFIPQETVNDETVLILAWKFDSGSYVELNQLICEVETSKAVLEIHAPAAGFLVYHHAAGDELPVGATICTIESEAPERAAGARESTLPASDMPPARLSAEARRTAQEYGLAASSFPPGTLVTRQDVLRLAGKAEGETESESSAAHAAPIAWADLPRRKLVERKILQRARESTVQSSVTSACPSKQLGRRLQEMGLPAWAIQVLVIYETAKLLRTYSEFNATYETGRIGTYSQINVGWALDGGLGLVVPVIREADKKTIHEIANVMERQTEAYLENSLSTDELLGATFTVTDLSSQGVSFFQPLLVAGQSAILGIGKGADADAMLYLTLAFDHQLSAGKKAAEFLRDLWARLESHASAAALQEIEEPPAVLQYCAICQRDSKTLQSMKVVLLKSEVPPGFVCALCVAGW